MPDGTKTLAGVLCGIGAGALWGLVFLAPELMTEFGPLQLAAGRYLCYGPRLSGPARPTLARARRLAHAEKWLALAWLALLGNTLYYVLLSNAVQSGGVAMTSLVIGFLPVAVTIVGSRDHGVLPLRGDDSCPRF